MTGGTSSGEKLHPETESLVFFFFKVGRVHMPVQSQLSPKILFMGSHLGLAN